MKLPAFGATGTAKAQAGGMSVSWTVVAVLVAVLALVIAAGGEKYVSILLGLTALALIVNKFDVISAQIKNLGEQL